MLHLATTHLVDALSTYIDVRTGTADAVVQSQLVDQGTGRLSITGKLVLSVVRLEEDRLSRSVEHYERVEGGAVRAVEPPVRLTAWLLLAATHDTYTEALKAVGHAVTFFQHLRSVDFAAIDGVEDTGRLLIEMDSPTFEEMNHLWGTVGAKYLPSVLYRVRLLSLTDARPAAAQPAIGRLDITAEA